MKKSILTTCLLLTGMVLYAQEVETETTGKSDKELRAEKKAAKKANRKAEEAEAIQNSNALLTGKQWTLEATRMQDRRGETFELNSSINFVSIQDDGGVVQLSFLGLPGWNGVGGITLEGNITKYELLLPQKPGTGGGVNARLQSSARSMDLQIKVTQGGFAEVTVQPTTSSGRITFTGQLVHPNESNVYKGQRRF